MLITNKSVIFNNTTYNLNNPKRIKALINRISKIALALDSTDNPEWDMRTEEIKKVCRAAGKSVLLKAGLEKHIKYCK